MLLDPRVLFSGLFSFAGIGSLVPASTLWSGGGGRYSTIWQVSSSSSKSFPLFTCSNNSHNIKISLALKDGNNNLTTGKEIVFKGYDENSKKEINLHDVERAGIAPFNLTIFGTGTVRLGETGNWESSHRYGGSLICDRNVFHVTKFIDYGSEKQWEKDFKSISLTLGGCEDKGGKRECSINIGSGVDLEWKNDFKPKVII